MIITVTTSICDQTSTRTSGFCDRCHLVCKSSLKTSAAVAAAAAVGEDADVDRRRHVSEAQATKKLDASGTTTSSAYT